MQVRELIERLSGLDPELEVMIEVGIGDFRDVKITERPIIGLHEEGREGMALVIKAGPA